MISPLNPFDFLERAAKLYPERTGVIDGNKRFTYSEFEERSIALGEALSSLGAAKGSVVSVIDYNTHHILELYYALTRTGFIINPLNFRYSASDLAYMIGYVKSTVVFVHNDFLPLIERMEGKLRSVQKIVLIEGNDNLSNGGKYLSYEDLTKNLKSRTQPEYIDENQVAEVLFTSGSSNKPKAVGLTNRNLYLNALYTMIAYRMTEEDALLHVVPLFHANGGGTPQMITAAGGKHVMLRKVDPEIMLKLIDRESITMFVAVPTVLRRFLSYAEFNSFDTSSLRQIIVVGTAASRDLFREVETKMPNCECFSAYGMTEAGPLVALSRPKSEDTRKLQPKELLELKTRTGYEVLGVKIKIDTPIGGPGGKEGEILIKGDSVFNGYYLDSKATSESITDGWFHTGDWGRELDDGWILMIDRAKDMIKSGGENISSVEVEETLMKHPSVAEAAVIPIPDEEWGEVPMAFVVPKPDAHIAQLEIMDFCRSKMAHFKAPRSVVFVDSLPKTVTGKVSKAELKNKYWSGRERRIS